MIKGVIVTQSGVGVLCILSECLWMDCMDG